MTKILPLFLLLTLACGKDLPLPEVPPLTMTTPDPEPVPTPLKVQPMPTPMPSRLALPAAMAQIGGVAVPVGPLHDTVTGRSCYLTDQGLCVPTDTVRVEPATETAFIDIDCTVGAVKVPSVARADLFDGARVWTLLTGMPQIPSGTAASAQRDPVTGQCRPARVIMAGGDWAFASWQVATTVWARVTGR